MKIAAYQAPFLAPGSTEAIELIRVRVRECERTGVEILCCPEAVLGGLADDHENPSEIAVSVANGQLQKLLEPLTSDSVTTVVGFTELAEDQRLYNAAAVFHRGAILGIYRKRHPAIRRSVYRAGTESPVFRVGALSFGIMICNDSNFSELAKDMVARGARVIFVPSNHGLPLARADVLASTKAVDIARAKDNRVMIARADVAGHFLDRTSFGSSVIVDEDGIVLSAGTALREGLLTADLYL